MSRLLSIGELIIPARIAVTVLGAAIAYVWQTRSQDRKSLVGFLRFCLPAGWWRRRCVRIDATMVLLQKLLGVTGEIPIVVMIAALAPLTHDALASWLGERPPEPAGFVVIALVALAVLMVRDFCDFYLHLLAHRWQVLWEFHAVHHSVEFLTPLSGKRAHMVDDLVRSGGCGAVVAPLVGVLTYAFAIPAADVMEVSLAAYLLTHLLDASDLQHSHIALSFGPLERLFISPAQHQLHHVRDEVPRNMGAVLSIWDRLFGTFERSRPAGSFACGLPLDIQPHYDSVLKLMVRPLRNTLAALRRGAAAGARRVCGLLARRPRRYGTAVPGAISGCASNIS